MVVLKSCSVHLEPDAACEDLACQALHKPGKPNASFLWQWLPSSSSPGSSGCCTSHRSDELCNISCSPHSLPCRYRQMPSPTEEHKCVDYSQRIFIKIFQKSKIFQKNIHQLTSSKAPLSGGIPSFLMDLRTENWRARRSLLWIATMFVRLLTVTNGIVKLASCDFCSCSMNSSMATSRSFRMVSLCESVTGSPIEFFTASRLTSFPRFSAEGKSPKQIFDNNRILEAPAILLCP